MCQSARWWCGGAKAEKQQVKEKELKELKVSWWRDEKVEKGALWDEKVEVPSLLLLTFIAF